MERVLYKHFWIILAGGAIVWLQMRGLIERESLYQPHLMLPFAFLLCHGQRLTAIRAVLNGPRQSYSWESKQVWLPNGCREPICSCQKGRKSRV